MPYNAIKLLGQLDSWLGRSSRMCLVYRLPITLEAIMLTVLASHGGRHKGCPRPKTGGLGGQKTPANFAHPPPRARLPKPVSESKYRAATVPTRYTTISPALPVGAHNGVA